MKTAILNRASYKSKLGFSILELMIATALFGLAMGAAIGVYIMCQKIWHATSLSMQVAREGQTAFTRMVYGVGANEGLRAAAIVSISSNAHGWILISSNAFDGVKQINYNKQASNIFWIDSINQSSRICAHVVSANVATNLFGVNFQLSLFRQAGRFTATNQISTFVRMRNKHL